MNDRSCKTSFITIQMLKNPMLMVYLKFVCNCCWWYYCHFTIICFVESSNTHMFQMNILLIVFYSFNHIAIFKIIILQLPSFWVGKARFKASSAYVFLFKKFAKKHLMKGQWINDSNDIYICSEENLRIWWNIWDCIICWNEILKIAWLVDKRVLKWPRYYGIYIHSRLRILLKLNFKLRSFYYLLLNLAILD